MRTYSLAALKEIDKIKETSNVHNLAVRLWDLQCALSQIAAEGWQSSEIAGHEDFIFLQKVARTALEKDRKNYE